MFTFLRLTILFHTMSSFTTGLPVLTYNIIPFDLHDLRLTSDTMEPGIFHVGMFGASNERPSNSAASAHQQPTSVYGVQVVLKRYLVQKCGDFADIYAGEVPTKALYDNASVRL